MRFEYFHFVVVDRGPSVESRHAAEASECANEQGEFWNFHKIVFANQQGEREGAFSDRRLKAFAETLGLDTQAFNQCFDSGRYSQNVLSDERLARSLGISSTPTIFVNGQVIQNPLNYDLLRQVIEQALAGG